MRNLITKSVVVVTIGMLKHILHAEITKPLHVWTCLKAIESLVNQMNQKGPCERMVSDSPRELIAKTIPNEPQLTRQREEVKIWMTMLLRVFEMYPNWVAGLEPDEKKYAAEALQHIVKQWQFLVNKHAKFYSSLELLQRQQGDCRHLSKQSLQEFLQFAGEHKKVSDKQLQQGFGIGGIAGEHGGSADFFGGQASVGSQATNDPKSDEGQGMKKRDATVAGLPGPSSLEKKQSMG